VSYDTAEGIQQRHRHDFLRHKQLSHEQRDETAAPRPRLLSFESTPTFTLGRRQEDLNGVQRTLLERELLVDLPHRRVPIRGTLKPYVRKTDRGGLTTYHGPGQLVLWPVLDMHSPLYPNFGVASYANHLEVTTQRLLADSFGIETTTLHDEPGVWVVDASSSANGQQPQRKIAALGVHHRRYVTGLGIAINMDMVVSGNEQVNPWSRFVPCGLEGKTATSVAAELGDKAANITWDLQDLANRWATIFEQGLLDVSKRGTDARTA
jgi:lipoyl(octanoyl) transferase